MQIILQEKRAARATRDKGSVTATRGQLKPIRKRAAKALTTCRQSTRSKLETAAVEDMEAGSVEAAKAYMTSMHFGKVGLSYDVCFSQDESHFEAQKRRKVRMDSRMEQAALKLKVTHIDVFCNRT